MSTKLCCSVTTLKIGYLEFDTLNTNYPMKVSNIECKLKH